MDDLKVSSAYQDAYEEAYNSRVSRVQRLADDSVDVAVEPSPWIFALAGLLLLAWVSLWLYSFVGRQRSYRLMEEEERTSRIRVRPPRHERDAYRFDVPSAYVPGRRDPSLDDEGATDSDDEETVSRRDHLRASAAIARACYTFLLRTALAFAIALLSGLRWIAGATANVSVRAYRAVRRPLQKSCLCRHLRALKRFAERRGTVADAIASSDLSRILTRTRCFVSVVFCTIATLYLFKPILPDLPDLWTPTAGSADVAYYSWTSWLDDKDPPRGSAVDSEESTRVVDWYGTRTFAAGLQEAIRPPLHLPKGVEHWLRHARERAARETAMSWQVTRTVTATATATATTTATVTVTDTKRIPPAVTSERTVTTTSIVVSETTTTHTLERTFVSVLVATTTETATVKLHYTKAIQRLLNASSELMFTGHGRDATFCRTCGQVHCCDFEHKRHSA